MAAKHKDDLFNQSPKANEGSLPLDFTGGEKKEEPTKKEPEAKPAVEAPKKEAPQAPLMTSTPVPELQKPVETANEKHDDISFTTSARKPVHHVPPPYKKSVQEQAAVQTAQTQDAKQEVKETKPVTPAPAAEPQSSAVKAPEPPKQVEAPVKQEEKAPVATKVEPVKEPAPVSTPPPVPVQAATEPVTPAPVQEKRSEPVKLQPKSNEKQEKPEKKEEKKVEPKPEPKTEPKLESKHESKPEPKPETKVEHKPEPKVETKPEPAAQPKHQHRKEPVPPVRPHTAQQPQSKTQSKHEAHSTKEPVPVKSEDRKESGKPPKKFNVIEKFSSDNATSGQILQEGRVRSGLSIDQVSQKTKIKKNFLEALERDDFQNLPAPVYVNAYVRSLCDLYHVDEKQVMSLLNKNKGKALEFTVPEEVIQQLEKGKQINIDQQAKVKRIFISIAALFMIVAAGITVFYYLMKMGKTEAPVPVPVKVVSDNTVKKPIVTSKSIQDEMEKKLIPPHVFTMTQLPLPER